jgi:hypothetical protein
LLSDLSGNQSSIDFEERLSVTRDGTPSLQDKLAYWSGNHRFRKRFRFQCDQIGDIPLL